MTPTKPFPSTPAEALHDIRGQLGTVIANAYILQTQESAPAEVRAMAADVHEAATAIKRFVDALARMLGIELPPPRPYPGGAASSDADGGGPPEGQ